MPATSSAPDSSQSPPGFMIVPGNPRLPLQPGQRGFPSQDYLTWPPLAAQAQQRRIHLLRLQREVQLFGAGVGGARYHQRRSAEAAGEVDRRVLDVLIGVVPWHRSEEHTSELQSPCNLV